MKKIIYSVIVVLLLISGILVSIFYEKDDVKEPIVIEKNNTSLMSFGEYKNIKVEDINYIELLNYTEAGVDTSLIKSKDEIISTYNYLAKKSVGSRTNMSCEDNTRIYKFYMNDNRLYKIEIECDVLIYYNDRYVVR